MNNPDDFPIIFSTGISAVCFSRVPLEERKFQGADMIKGNTRIKFKVKNVRKNYRTY